MPKIVTVTEINTSIELAFDLSRSIEFHTFSQSHRNEKPIEGRTSGLIELGERVTWKAKHLGISQKLTVEITKFEKPYSFRDSMIKGAFQRFDHDHIFEQNNGTVKLIDVFDYDSPLAWLGKIADKVFLENYMTNFSLERNLQIKEALESDLWKSFLK